MDRSILTVLCVLVLVACSSASAPFADVLPDGTTSVSDTPAPATDELRYGLDERLNGLIDLSLLEKRALITWLPTGASVIGYDVALALADGTGWAVAPQRLTLSIALDSRLAPLDQPEVLDIVRRAWQPNADALALRMAWANLGRLDSPYLVMRYADHPFIPKLSAPTLALLSYPSANLLGDWQARRAHLYLLLWSDPAMRSAWEARVGAEHMIDLASWPIGYRLGEGVQLTGFRPDGLPLVQRTAP
ncbi:MAG: hypothetical protein NZ750_05060 [Anaerolineae bacterium]|nr:hypothetical protein [Anaerolineae bacterium]MDW8173569.1 hypothetical protein [Anaerolineae bacterium]